MIKEKLVLKFLGLLLFCVSVSYAETYLVTASNEVPNMSPDFWMTGYELKVENEAPYITVEFTGNCAEKVVNRCNTQKHNDHYDFEPLSRYHHHGPSGNKGHHHSDRNRHSSYNSCWTESKLICEHQEGNYKLPENKIIYDGEKRWKFIGDRGEQYVTIARHDRSGLSRKWKLRSYVELNVAPNGYQSLTLTIHQPTK